MTRLPANLSDPSLQANLKSSDIRRNSTTDLADTGFYRALLATAPLQTLGNFPSDWTLQHLAPVAPKVEPIRRSESTPRSESTTVEPFRPDDEDEAPRRTLKSASGRPTTEVTNDPRNNSARQKFAPIHGLDQRILANVPRAPEIAVGTEIADGTEIAVGTEIETEPRNLSPFLTRPISKRRDELAVGDSTKLFPIKAADEVLPQKETEAPLGAIVPLPAYDAPLPKVDFNFDQEQLESAAETSEFPTPQLDRQPFLSPAIRSEGFPTAAEVVRRILAQTGKTDTESTGSKVPVSSEGQIKLDRGLWRPANADDEQTRLFVQRTGKVETQVDPNARVRVDQLATIENVVAQENLSAVELTADETIEISFKPDASVVQRSGRQGPREGRRGLARNEQSETSIGSRPGGYEPAPSVFTRPDKLSNNRVNAVVPTPLSLDQIPVLPNGQKLALATGNSQSIATANPGLDLPSIALEMPGQLDDFSVAFTREVGSNATATSLPSTTPSLPVAGTSVNSNGGVVKSGDVEALLPVPSRVLNQVSQALKQAPAGDSTMRLQLNPVELGQLMIEISFRDGVMHGKLRAEQAPTLKLLQDGLDGLRTRLNEQGIVVQTLEVELGQQGDFSQDQQQRSFGQGQEFGQQRKSNGYFSGDGPPIRRNSPPSETVSQPTNRNHDGRWAVNVIV